MQAYSIRWFLLFVVLIALLPGVIGTAYEINRSFDQQQQAAVEISQHAAGAAADRVTNFLASTESVVRGLARQPGVATLDPARCRSALAESMAVLPDYANVIVVGEQGWVVCSAIPLPDEEIRRIDTSFYFDRLKETGRLTIGNPSSAGVVSGRRIVAVAEPLISGSGEIYGAVALSIDLLRFVREMPRIPHTQSYLLARNGGVVSATESPEHWIAHSPAMRPFFDLADTAVQLSDVVGPGGRSYLVAKQPVDGYDWTMIVAIPTDEAFQAARQQIWRSVALHGSVLLLACVAAFWMSSRIALPLSAMTENVIHIRETGQRHLFKVDGPAEVRALAQQANVVLTEADEREKLLRITDRRLALAIEANGDGVWDLDLTTGYFEYSDRWLEMLGYVRGDLQPTLDGLRSIVHPDDDPVVAAAFRDHLSGNADFFFTEHRMRCKDGTYKWVLNRGAIVDTDADGRPARIAGTHTDIDARKAAEISLQHAGIVFERSPQAILVTDERNIIQRVNPAFERATGYSAAEVVGRNPSLLSSGRQGPDFYKAMWGQLQATGEWQGEIWNRRKDGTAYCEWLTVTQMRHDGHATGHIGMFIDITQRKEAEAQVEWRANFDTLTTLPNRHLLLDRIDQAVKRARRSTVGGAVMLLDLDHFKEINDSLGHQAGDAVLIEVASRLQKVMRENDTVGRLGGDEFVVLLTDLPAEQASAVAERILQALTAPVTVSGRELQTAASIGIATYPDDGDDPSELLRLADMAMYSAKAAGRGSWQMFTQQMDQQSRRRLDLIADLRVALAQDQIELFYQPIVDIATGDVVKAEGLARWRHPRHGFIPPDQFIALAEETGLIHPLGQVVLATGMAARQRINDAGLNCQISVNISSRQIGLPAFAAEVRHLLENENMAVNPIVFEVTESLLLADFERACALLREFADAGAVIALDDFGTGYSSLSYLYRLPASILKIDRSFTINLQQRPDVRRLVQAIIDLGHDLGFRIVAEGVETADQRAVLSEMGCDYGQGYYFAKPMPLDDLMLLLDRNARLAIPA